MYHHLETYFPSWIDVPRYESTLEISATETRQKCRFYEVIVIVRHSRVIRTPNRSSTTKKVGLLAEGLVRLTYTVFTFRHIMWLQANHFRSVLMIEEET